VASQEAPRRDPEVVAIARRRQFSGSEKRRLLAEAERCKEAGTLGAFLRRERIYSSMITSWRKQVGVADQAALSPKRRGPKPDPSTRQIQQLERDNVRLRHKLERDELINRRPKKLCVALGLPTAERHKRGRVMLAVAELTPHVGLSSACAAFALGRRFVYRDRVRRRMTASRHVPRARPRPPLAFSIAEQYLLLGLLDSERFAPRALPRFVTPTGQSAPLRSIGTFSLAVGAACAFPLALPARFSRSVHMPELHQPGSIAQLQNLPEQLAKRLQLPLAEVRDDAEIRCIERHNAHEIDALAARFAMRREE
jgi:transposase